MYSSTQHSTMWETKESKRLNKHVWGKPNFHVAAIDFDLLKTLIVSEGLQLDLCGFD